MFSFWWIFSGGLAVSFGGCSDSLISPGALFHKENGGKTLGMEGPSCLGPSRWSPLKGDWDPINTQLIIKGIRVPMTQSFRKR